MSVEEPGGRSLQTANEQLCTVRRHNQPHPRLGHKTGILFAEQTTAYLRVLPASLGQCRHGRRAQARGLRVDESRTPSRPFIEYLRYRWWCSGFIDGGKR
jgi:hypothetical protein